MSSNNDQPSTLQSYVDSATGAVQNAFGALTGSSSDKAAGQNKKAEGQAKDDASHATLKLPGMTATASGVTADDSRRSEGSWNQTLGSGKEMVGSMFGAEGLKQEGIRQNQHGKAMEAQGQLSDFGSGAADRFQGTVGGAFSSLTGDKAGQAHYQQLHDQGKTTQRGAEVDIQRQADAENASRRH